MSEFDTRHEIEEGEEEKEEEKEEEEVLDEQSDEEEQLHVVNTSTWHERFISRPWPS